MHRTKLLAGIAGLFAAAGLIAAAPGLAPHMKWEAQLHPIGTYTFVGGRATIESSPRGDSTVFSIMVTGADTATTHPWHIHKNACDTKTGGEIAPIAAFPPVAMASTSSDPNAPVSGSASVTLPVRTPTSGKYSVQVYASPKDTSIVLACGDFMKPAK